MTFKDSPTVTVDTGPLDRIVDKDLPQPHQINYQVTADTIRNFAHAVDDPNALYLDEEYARSTRWGGVIASPGYLASHGSSAWLARYVPKLRDSAGNELSELVHASEEWKFLRPVRPGDHILSHSKMSSAEAKFGSRVGASVRVNLFTRYFNHRGEDVATRTDVCFLLKKSQTGAGAAADYPPLKDGASRNVIQPTRFPGTFTQAVAVRFARLRARDVNLGARLPDLKIPPVMLQNLGRYCAVTLASGVDETGGPMGSLPDAYVFGHLRVPWFARLLTNWAGPDCWIEELSQRDKSWLLIGFAVTCSGTVVDSGQDGDRAWFHVDMECRNELGHVTNTGSAKVTLRLGSA